MTAIVMNTLTGAVSEHTLDFNSMTQTHAANASGLYTLGGDTDNGVSIVAEIVTGETLWGASLKKRLEQVYFSTPRSEGEGELIVHARSVSDEVTEHRYAFPLRGSGQSRGTPGKGIRANYLAFGFSNPAGDDFTLDRIEVAVVESNNRRV